MIVVSSQRQAGRRLSASGPAATHRTPTRVPLFSDRNASPPTYEEATGSSRARINAREAQRTGPQWQLPLDMFPLQRQIEQVPRIPRIDDRSSNDSDEQQTTPLPSHDVQSPQHLTIRIPVSALRIGQPATVVIVASFQLQPVPVSALRSDQQSNPTIDLHPDTDIRENLATGTDDCTGASYWHGPEQQLAGSNHTLPHSLPYDLQTIGILSDDSSASSDFIDSGYFDPDGY